jgi:myosin heavy subunit
LFPTLTDICNLSNDIYEYHYVSQGKTTIPNVDDGEEFQLTDVSEPVNPVVAAQ